MDATTEASKSEPLINNNSQSLLPLSPIQALRSTVKNRVNPNPPSVHRLRTSLLHAATHQAWTRQPKRPKASSSSSASTTQIGLAKTTSPPTGQATNGEGHVYTQEYVYLYYAIMCVFLPCCNIYIYIYIYIHIYRHIYNIYRVNRVPPPNTQQ